MQGKAYFLRTWGDMCNYEQNEVYDEGTRWRRCDTRKAECRRRIKLRPSANVHTGVR